MENFKDISTLFGKLLGPKKNEIDIDLPITKMHHKLTKTLLWFRCILVTGLHWVGYPIQCFGVPAVPQETLNTYCWLKNTFVVPSK